MGCNPPDRGRGRSDRGAEVPWPSLHSHHRPVRPKEVPLGDTHLTDLTKHHAIDRINGLMDGFGIRWGRVK